RTWDVAAGAGPLTGPGLTLAGAAAGRPGYVVAGVRDVHGQPMAALWWAADLSTWDPRGWGGGTGASGVASALLAEEQGPAARALGVCGGPGGIARRGRRGRAPGRRALPGRPGMAGAVAGAARRCAQRGTPARGHPGKPYHSPWHAGAAVRTGAVRRRLGQR